MSLSSLTLKSLFASSESQSLEYLTIIVSQIDATVDLTLATLLGPGSYTIFYLAQRLQLLPVSVFGMALGQASLPYLTEVFQEKRLKEFKNIIVNSMLSIFFFTIPSPHFSLSRELPLFGFFTEVKNLTGTQRFSRHLPCPISQ